jgi:hypothetical protein
MTGLEWILAVAGFGITTIVVVAMILITPSGVIDAPDGAADPDGAELPRGVDRPPAPAAAGAPR